MRKIGYAAYVLWVTAALVLKILGLVSWAVALSWLWFPAALVTTFVAGLNLSVWIGRKIKEREDSKIPDTCDTCLFGQMSEYSADGKCLGCELNPEWEYGHICETYKRNIIRK